MQKPLMFLLLLIIPYLSYAISNYQYYTTGGLLIPMEKTDISLRKVFISMKKITTTAGNRQMQVTVCYQFYNPSPSCRLVVAYETPSPQWDERPAGITLKKGNPYLHNFSLIINNLPLQYQVAITGAEEVKGSYYRQGRVETLPSSLINKLDETNRHTPEINYIYYADMPFIQGINTVENSWICDLPSYNIFELTYDFAFSATPLWKGGRIGDFTINLDMGDDEVFVIYKTFFKHPADWVIKGIGNKRSNYFEADGDKYSDEAGKVIQFYIKNGTIKFHKTNFKPTEDFFLASFTTHTLLGTGLDFDYRKEKELDHRTATSGFWKQDKTIGEQISKLDDVSKEILRNLPYACRGYIFSDTVIQEYYQRQVWYMPNKNYKIDFTSFSANEKEWIGLYTTQ